MYKLILILLVSALMFGCSREDASDAVDAAKEHAGDAVDAAKEHGGDAAKEHGGDAAKEHGGEHAGEAAAMDGPKLEPLPDWDSLPPIEEEGAAAEDGETMMEKAESAAGDAVEKAKEHAGDAAEKMKEHAGDAAEEMMKKE